MDSFIRFVCPSCGKSVKVNPDQAGKRVRCLRRECGAVLVVPAPGELCSATPHKPTRRTVPNSCGADPRRKQRGKAVVPLRWLGFLLMVGCAAFVLLRPLIPVRFPDWIAFPMGLVMLSAALAGLTLSILGAILNRGEVGGTLGVLLGIGLAVLMCVLLRQDSVSDAKARRTIRAAGGGRNLGFSAFSVPQCSRRC